MAEKIFRVAIMGPESSGKTTLAQQLAEQYQTIWVPEFSRAHVEQLKRPYTKSDILYSAKMQWESEMEALTKANKFLFSDTEMINCRVWLKDVYDEEDEWINQKVREQDYDLYLLLSPDLPFVDDPVRENKDRREFFFEWYKKELEGKRYVIIEGVGKERFRNALRAVEMFQKSSRAAT